MVSANGQTLPVTLDSLKSAPSAPLERRTRLVGGKGQVNEDHTFSLALAFLNYSTNSGLESPDTLFYAGTWSGNADAMVFTIAPNGGTATGAFSNGHMTLMLPIAPFSFSQFGVTLYNQTYDFVRQ